MMPFSSIGLKISSLPYIYIYHVHVTCYVFVQLEKGVDGLFKSFARLDTRISSVGQTAAKIGDHLQVIYLL